MYCNACGQANPEDAVYCKKCGTAIEHEEETRVAKRSESPGHLKTDENGPERKIFVINPTLKFVALGYVAAVVAAFALVVILTIFIPGFAPLIGVGLGLLLLLVPVYYHAKQKLIRYALTEATIEIDRGLISRTTQNIPLRRVQDVTVTSTLIQRMLGYGDIAIDNASEDGGKIVLDNIDSPKRYAEMILRQMRQLER